MPLNPNPYGVTSRAEDRLEGPLAVGEFVECRDPGEYHGPDPCDLFGVVKVVNALEPRYGVQLMCEGAEAELSLFDSQDVRRPVVLDYEQWRGAIAASGKIAIDGNAKSSTTFGTTDEAFQLPVEYFQPIECLDPFAFPPTPAHAQICEAERLLAYAKRRTYDPAELVEKLTTEQLKQRILNTWTQKKSIMADVQQTTGVDDKNTRLSETAARLRAEVQQLEQEVLCTICFTAYVNVQLHPCKHLSFCLECMESCPEEKCPLCRKEIKRMDRV
jgi:hypothetical protein